jgi:tetraacyldisaccharide 4'-kinase
MYLPHVKTIPILLPLAGLYSLGVWLRNLAFDRGWLHSESFSVPVISVGNVAAGGTGKTPHTEYIIRLLQREGIGPIAVLSRGYKRRSKGFVLAEPGITASRLGDESYQIYRKFPDLIVAVDTDRVRGIHRLLELPEPPAVILLDDAFQHRYVKPGLNIVLTSYNRILYKDFMLPAGLLREPRHAVRRADVVVVTKCPPALRLEETTEIEGHLPTDPMQPILYSSYTYRQPINLATGQPADIDHTCEVLLVTGIADPGVLEQYIQTHYRLLEEMTYGDHHHFSNADVANIRARLKAVNSDGNCTNDCARAPIIITTEKDAVRLLNHPAVDDELKKCIYYLPTEVRFLDHAEVPTFDRMILDFVRGFK